MLCFSEKYGILILDHDAGRMGEVFMKRILNFIFAAAIISALSSCSAGEAEEQSESDITTVSDTPSAASSETEDDISAEITSLPEESGEKLSEEITASETEESGEDPDAETAVSTDSEPVRTVKASETQEETAAETSGTTVYNKEVYIRAEDKTLKRPSEEFLREVLAGVSNEFGTVVFYMRSDGTYFVHNGERFYAYTNEDKRIIYEDIAEKLDRNYYEENKEQFKERDHVSNYEEYIKLMEKFYGEEWMELYRTYDPDNIESMVQFVIYPSAYRSDFAAGSSDYSNEEVFLKLAEQLFKDTDIMTYAMTERLESGDNFYVRASGEYKGDNVVKYRSAFGYDPYEVSNGMDHASRKYFTMDGSELPEEYKD